MYPKMAVIEASNLLGLTVQAIHKQLKVKNLEFKKNQNRVYFGHETAKTIFGFSFKPQVITTQIVKGGTGKTSITQSIAIRASLYGARVLCIDLDQQGNLTQSFKINPEELPVMIDILKENINIRQCIVPVLPGLDLLPSRIENAILDNEIMLESHPLDRVYKDKIDSIRKDYDLIIIDCPPDLGQSVAAATLASKTIITPVTPEKFCLSGLKITNQELNSLEHKFKKKITSRIVLNKFDSRTSLSHEILSTLIKNPTYSNKMYKTYVRISQEFPNSIADCNSIFDSLRPNTAKEDIDLLTREIMDIKIKTMYKEDFSLGSLTEQNNKFIESL